MNLLVDRGMPSLLKLRHPRLGRLVTPRQRGGLEDMEAESILWAADNDAFTVFNEDRYRSMLAALVDTKACTFVTCPDVVGDALGTLKLFSVWQPQLRAMNLPVALVGQDGLEDLDVPWDKFDAFFIGGGTEWKLGAGARRLVNDAKNHGKWVHMGRVNSHRRIRYAHSIGCDSVDGSGYSRFFNTHVPRALALLDALG